MISYSYNYVAGRSIEDFYLHVNASEPEYLTKEAIAHYCNGKWNWLCRYGGGYDKTINMSALNEHLYVITLTGGLHKIDVNGNINYDIIPYLQEEAMSKASPPILNDAQLLSEREIVGCSDEGILYFCRDGIWCAVSICPSVSINSIVSSASALLLAAGDTIYVVQNDIVSNAFTSNGVNCVSASLFGNVLSVITILDRKCQLTEFTFPGFEFINTNPLPDYSMFVAQDSTGQKYVSSLSSGFFKINDDLNIRISVNNCRPFQFLGTVGIVNEETIPPQIHFCNGDKVNIIPILLDDTYLSE